MCTRGSIKYTQFWAFSCRFTSRARLMHKSYTRQTPPSTSTKHVIYIHYYAPGILSMDHGSDFVSPVSALSSPSSSCSSTSPGSLPLCADTDAVELDCGCGSVGCGDSALFPSMSTSTSSNSVIRVPSPAWLSRAPTVRSCVRGGGACV